MKIRDIEDALLSGRGLFTDEKGNVQPEPPDDVAFPIVCGRWPRKEPEAIRVQCARCYCDVAVSPVGHAFQAKNAKRFFVCFECMAALALLEQILAAKPKPKPWMH